MKKLVIVLLLSIALIGLGSAQETQESNGANWYTFFVNSVNDQFRFPLIGLVNSARGSHAMPQIGFINWNLNNFRTLQLAFVNIVGGNMTGAQIGFVNTTVDSFNGLQLGFVNTAKQLNGLQAGFINTVAGDRMGIQAGFVNTAAGGMMGIQTGFINTAAGDTMSIQAGFINTAAGGMIGIQTGFINTAAGGTIGIQTGFVNTAKQLNGLQFGFINYADSTEKGIPVGFLSIVKNGGYKAIELGVSELSPFTVSFKIGVERFYTSCTVGYNPFKDGIREQIIFGAGLGSIIRLGKRCYFNPEITAHNRINEGFQRYISVIPYFGYTIIPNLSIVIGPSALWTYVNKEREKDAESPRYSILSYSINDENLLYLGARVALRFRW
ncbi:MAG: hypothetical protein LBB43_01220 [Spirochaetaceae bacterium]|jgi:hypothetical protein|nr:hypothetical protein [Spirochaetaceae bacterium]